MEFVTVQSLLVQGKEHVEVVETLIGNFQVRALTLGEKAEIQSSSLTGVKSKTKAKMDENSKGLPEETEVDIDFVAMQGNQWEAKFKVLAYGLSVGKQRYEPRTIKKLTVANTILDMLYKRIMEVSEVTERDLVPFRQDEDGASPGDDATVGDSVHEDNQRND